MPESALHGLRVIDLTDDAGRFATKLLTELGADVVRISAAGGSGEAMADPAAARHGGVLDWWYDGGKSRHTLDLDRPDHRDRYRRLASVADLVIETETPGRLAELEIDHPDLLVRNAALCQVSITPFGRSGPWANWHGSDLVAAALGGVMAVTGLPERPLNVWGRQAYNFAGFAGALAGLAVVRAAATDGCGRHVDLSIHETLTGSIENIFMQYFFDDLLDLPRIAGRQGALHWLRAYDVAECRTGHTMITPTPTPEFVVQWMLEEGHAAAGAFLGLDIESVVARVDELMGCIRDFVRHYDAMDLWWEAQNRHCAFGGVHDVAAVVQIPQFEHRGFLGDVDMPDPEAAPSTPVRMPRRLVEMSETPAVPLRPPTRNDAELDQLLSRWGRSARPAVAGERLARPLQGLRIADFTWVLAGPFCTRMLGDLGADVIRVQNEARSTLVNRADHPYYFVWNRSKRSATLNMKHPDALTAARRLIEHSDVVIENYSAGVMDSWGLDWETVHEWNPQLVYVTMSGCGHEGPWKHVISYAPTIHALCGVTHLTNFADRGDVGAGFSLNDHLAGFTAAVVTLAALSARERTGMGQKVDLAQLDIGSYAIGPALLDHLSNGRTSHPAGNRDGLEDHVPNEVFATRDGFVAVSVTSDEQWRALAEVVGEALQDPALGSVAHRRARRRDVESAIGAWVSSRSAHDAMETLQLAGVPAGKVHHAGELFADDPQHRARGFWQPVHHGGFGRRHVDTFPALIDGERLPVERLSPVYLGEHNFEVWTEVGGYDVDDVAEGMGTDLFA